jgi:catechol 2,3-dioxygenase-like lactoylglutathione lyase family enzyme
MSESISCLHMNHLNALVEGSEGSSAESVAHFRDLFGAQFLLDLPEFQSCLIIIGPVIFELFLPTDYLLNARFGPHYVGVEYQVPDTAEARRAVQARGLRLLGDIGVAFHTHPDDTFGVAVEMYHRNFHTQGPPNGYLEPIRSPRYWSDEHPLGLTGLKRYSVVVADLAAATSFFCEFMNATVVYEEARPAVGARAVGLALGDTVAELLTPIGVGEIGEIQRSLARYGDGIRSTVFTVRDLEGARSYFAERGITLRPGDAPGTLAIAPEVNQGLMFEFSE